MKKPRSAGELTESVALDRRVDENPDSPADYGVVQSAWQEQFVTRAAFIFAGGNETVVAARLEGRNIMKVRIRSFAASRLVTSDWRLRDARRGTEYAITNVDTVTDKQWVYLVVESGVAP